MSDVNQDLSRFTLEIRHTMVGALKVIHDLGWQPGAVIDIGVATGTAGLYQFWPDATYCMIEPSPASMPYMERLSSRLSKAVIFNEGASDRTGVATVAKHPEVVNVLFADKPKWEAIEVPVRPCDDMVAEAGLEGPYLYKVDTDSHEMEILRGSERTLEKSDVVIIELNFFNVLRGRALPGDILMFLLERGFQPFDFGDRNYAASGVLRGLDFVFVRSDSELFEAAFRSTGKTRGDRTKVKW
jgi:FkbM family methyltransferase